MPARRFQELRSTTAFGQIPADITPPTTTPSPPHWPLVHFSCHRRPNAPILPPSRKKGPPQLAAGTSKESDFAVAASHERGKQPPASKRMTPNPDALAARHNLGSRPAAMLFLAEASPTPSTEPDPMGLGPGLVIGSLLLLLILLCVLGNLLVILAILFERDLRSRPQYYLIFSLAVADLLVGLFVTPLGAWTTLRQKWELGVTLCDFWICLDVLVCTSSILHLVAIALDRYWSITNIYYTQNRTPRRIFTMLLIIWVLSLLISLAPQFEFLHLKDKGFVSRVEDQKVCLISQDIYYQIFSTSTAFYIPLCAIILIYYKIMRAAKKRFRRERDRRTMNRGVPDEVPLPPKASKMLTSQNAPTPTPSPSMQNNSTARCSLSQVNLASSNNTLCPGGQQNGHFKAKLKKFHKPAESAQTSNAPLSPEEEEEDDEERTQLQLTSAVETDQPTCCLGDIAETEFQADGKAKIGKRPGTRQLLSFPRPLRRKKKRGIKKESVETRRERKAWRTLAIITGTFIACWTPFFVLSLYRPICMNINRASTGESQCRSIPPLMEQIFNWLGYLNSALNPVIYTIFSLDFRMAFERILKKAFFIR